VNAMLSPINNLLENGYVVMRQVFNPKELQDFLVFCKKQSLEVVNPDLIPRLNTGSDIIYNPFVEDIRFLRLFEEPQLLKVISDALNDSYYKNLDGLPTFILRSMICRSSKEMLPWHIDSFIPYSGSFVSTVQVVIPLEPFTKDSGPTLLLPKSHQYGQYASQLEEEDPRVVEVEAAVGDVIFWDSRIWHAAKARTSSNTRWAIIATFCRWWIKQNFDYPMLMKQNSNKGNLNDIDLALLGVASRVPSSPAESIDLKGGIGKLEAYKQA
jgi:hypothetical protein